MCSVVLICFDFCTSLSHTLKLHKPHLARYKYIISRHKCDVTTDRLGIGRLTGQSPVRAGHVENWLIPVPGQSIGASLLLWSDESKFDILVGNHGRRVLRAKEEGDLPACHQRSVQKPASLMVWGCISAYGMGSLHVLEGTMNAERYIKVLEQHMLPSR